MSDLFDLAERRVASHRRRGTADRGHTAADRKSAVHAAVETYHAALAAKGAGATSGPCFACMLATCPGCQHDAAALCAADSRHKRGYRFLADDGTPAGDGQVCAQCFWRRDASVIREGMS